MNLDVRWRQRLANYAKAFSQLESAVDLGRARALSDLEMQGLIEAFEFTHELAWKLIKDYFAYPGNPAIAGSRDAVREAFAQGLIDDGESWMEMIESRNRTSHTYQLSVASDIAARIAERYHPLFKRLLATMQNLSNEQPLWVDSANPGANSRSFSQAPEH